MSLRRSTTRAKAQASGDAAGPRQKRGLADVQQGILQLHPEPGSEKDKETEIDIVFVPGLGAHPVNSWMSETTKFNWAVDKEGIAKDFPNARILLYMYESAWMGGLKVKQFLGNLAYTLLHGLDGIRNESEKSNPIVFIGHSMGGLVIAKAICLAESRKNVYPHLFEDIAGCATFGTPFKGAEAASMAVMLSYIGEKMAKAEPSKLLELMRPDDESLTELRRDFVRAVGELHPKIVLFGFWEEHKTKFSDLGPVPDFIKRLGIPLPKNLAEFVTRDSAILDCMDSMGLAANHRDLVKFESSKDLRYALVRSPLKRLINGAALVVKNRRQSTRHIDRDLVNKAMDALDGARVWKKRDEIGQKFTLSSWVPDEPEYIGWLSKDGALPVSQGSEHLELGQYLWIRGPDGRGKTSATLAALNGIDKMIETHRSPILLAYFFCDNTSDHGTAEELVKSLLWQLIKKQETLASHAKFLLSRTGKGDSKGQPLLTVENLWQVLQDILADTSLSNTRIYLVINNLDALRDSNSTSTLLDLLNMEIKNRTGRHALVRWMITSGESYSIGQALKGESVRLIDLEDAKYSDQVQLELKNHASEKVSALVRDKNYSPALRYFVSSLIGKRAQNTQWIDITCVHLKELPAKTDLQVRLQLEVVPQELDALLNFAWQQIFDVNRARVAEIKEMLRVLVLTNEDPTEQELALLAGLDSPEEQADLHDLVSKCKPLLSIKSNTKSDTTVCFIDPVVKKHLLENAHKMLGLSEEDVKLQHGMLGLRAFDHVMKALKDISTTQPDEGDDGEEDGQSTDDESDGEDDDDDDEEEEEEDDGGDDDDDDDDNDDGEEDEDEDPEALDIIGKAHAYAIKYWLHHASQATTDIADDLSKEVEFWKKDSVIRRRWLTEHHRLTDSFKNYERAELTGLHVASAIGFRGLVAALLKNGYDDEKNMRDSLCYTPLHFAAAFGKTDIIEELLNKGAPINNGMEDNLQTPLHLAAANGNVKAMVMLLQREADPNASCDSFGRVINAAVDSGNCDAVKLLVEKDVSLEGEDSEEEEDDETEGENENKDNEDEDEDDENEDEDDDEDGDDDDEDDEEEFIRSPLALAALRSDLTMFEFLIKNYSEKLPPKEFNKALIKAAESGRLEAFNRLFDSYEHPEETFQKALEGASYAEKWDIVAILLEKRPGLNCDLPFLDAAESDDGDQAIRSIEAMWEYTNGSISAETLDKSLYQATDYQNEKTVQLLLRFGASPDATGEEYGNALTAAAYDGTKNIVNMLLDAKADINSPNGWALQTAAAEGHMEIVELLLERGADVNALTTNENMSSGTALQAAVEARNEDIVALLLEHGADPNLGGGSLTCPIIAAANNGEKEILERLINAKADVNRLGGQYNSTPLTYAAMYLPQESLRSILDAGADINFADEDGDTPLILAARVPDAESVQFLLDRGADVLLKNNDNYNALDVAVGTEDIACIRAVATHVSAIMEALSVAMAGGDAAVTAVVRSVENRKQELNYDEPIPEEDEEEEEEDSQGTAEPVEVEGTIPGAAEGKHEQTLNRPASEAISFDSTSTLVPEEAGGSGSQTPDNGAALRNSHQPPQAGFAPIRRKPITSARPTPYRPYQPPSDGTQQPGSEQNQYFAYRPGAQPETGAPVPQPPEQAPQWPPNPAGVGEQ
ncbi:hypothetical protein CDV31_008567 [Fusarium ambrosium]|uniref:Uncharacterized protein n=1 Tax=Fusarium ambrosium TaxID=131363 RepID=A0A428U075_9HYPO|nr:hypothetical protein CDV31_008567 [Fusarium ambrosium]